MHHIKLICDAYSTLGTKTSSPTVHSPSSAFEVIWQLTRRRGLAYSLNYLLTYTVNKSIISQKAEINSKMFLYASGFLPRHR